MRDRQKELNSIHASLCAWAEPRRTTDEEIMSYFYERRVERSGFDEPGEGYYVVRWWRNGWGYSSPLRFTSSLDEAIRLVNSVVQDSTATWLLLDAVQSWSKAPGTVLVNLYLKKFIQYLYEVECGERASQVRCVEKV